MYLELLLHNLANVVLVLAVVLLYLLKALVLQSIRRAWVQRTYRLARQLACWLSEAALLLEVMRVLCFLEGLSLSTVLRGVLPQLHLSLLHLRGRLLKSAVSCVYRLFMSPEQFLSSQVHNLFLVL